MSKAKRAEWNSIDLKNGIRVGKASLSPSASVNKSLHISRSSFYTNSKGSNSGVGNKSSKVNDM